MARIFILAVFLSCFASQVQAAGYVPGTVGYLYADCQKALEASTTLTELQSSICGAFAEGYAGGALSSNWATLAADAQDPCKAEKDREYDRINNRVCAALPRPDLTKASTGDALKTAVEIVTRWLAFEQARKPDLMKRRAVKEINSMVTPGPFCDDLAKNSAMQKPALNINPGLTNTKLNDYLATVQNLNPEAKYKQCQVDVAWAGGDSLKFLGTRCGSEISGYIAGLFSTRFLQHNRDTPSKSCRKEIDRLYKNLDMTTAMCVRYDTNPLRVAEIFLKKYSEIKKPDAVMSGVGQMTISSGFLCADQRAADEPLTPIP